ncbi:MAG: hypothetical protein OXU69_03175 [Gemmatimonadota bacterium]|nr:hypothetical protein [Gemmatimonadota bacterium]MDE2983685.1 hypothetical protein [Gemmatimonadota bacterium]
MTITLGTVLVGILALALGILLGLPGKGGPSAARGRRWKVHTSGSSSEVHDKGELDQLERDLSRPTTISRRAKRYFTPLGFLRKEPRASDRRRSRRYFHTAAPTRKPPGGADSRRAPTRKGNRPQP